MHSGSWSLKPQQVQNQDRQYYLSANEFGKPSVALCHILLGQGTKELGLADMNGSALNLFWVVAVQVHLTQSP